MVGGGRGEENPSGHLVPKNTTETARFPRQSRNDRHTVGNALQFSQNNTPPRHHITVNLCHLDSATRIHVNSLQGSTMLSKAPTLSVAILWFSYLLSPNWNKNKCIFQSVIIYNRNNCDISHKSKCLQAIMALVSTCYFQWEEMKVLINMI